MSTDPYTILLQQLIDAIETMCRCTEHAGRTRAVSIVEHSVIRIRLLLDNEEEAESRHKQRELSDKILLRLLMEAQTITGASERRGLN